MLIQTILGSIAVGSMAGIYKIIKNSKDAEDKEIIVENITKYEYIPLEDNENIMFKSFSFKDKIIYQRQVYFDSPIKIYFEDGLYRSAWDGFFYDDGVIYSALWDKAKPFKL